MERINNSIDGQAHTIESLLDNLVMLGNKQMTEKLTQHDLTVAQFLSMEALSDKGSECSMSELADRVHQSSATMTGIIDRLVEKGWVARRRSEEDRRAVYVNLTPSGHNLLRRVMAERQQLILTTLQKMSPDEVEQFINLLHRYMMASGLKTSNA